MTSQSHEVKPMRTLAIVAALFLSLLPAASAPPSSQEWAPEVLTLRDHAHHEGWLGVSVEDAESPDSAGKRATEGARVRHVVRKSPAEKAGLREGDVVLEINGKTIADRWDLLKAVRKAKPGSRAAIVVMRGDKRESLAATLGREPEFSGPSFRTPLHPLPPPSPVILPLPSPRPGMEAYGLPLVEMNGQLAAYFDAPGTAGILVEEVEDDSPGKRAGFKAGDVIVSIGGDTVRDDGDVWEALDRLKTGEKASIGILRKGARQSLSLDVIDHEASFRHMHRIPHWRHDFPWDSERFDQRMRELGQRLGKMGRNLGEQLKGLGLRLRLELRAIEV